MKDAREPTSWQMAWMRLQGLLMKQRHALGLTQDDLAERLGVNRKTIVRWENGERQAVGSQLLQWAAILGIVVTFELRDRTVPLAPSQPRPAD